MTAPIPARALTLAKILLLAGSAAIAGILPAPSKAQSLGVCSSFYAPDFTVAEGRNNPAMPQMSKPAKGTIFSEPNFRTCMTRGTAHESESPSTFARSDYSRRQAFNANNTYFIVYSKDGWWHLYDANTLQHLRQLSPRVPNPSTPVQYHMAGDAEPHWHPTDPNVLYYLPTNGGTKLLKLDVRNNSYSVAADFAGKLPSWADSARHIWTKSEGSPSADGRYWGFQVENADYRLLGYMVWDLQNNRLVGSMASSSRPDHSSMSAAGRWYVTSSDSTGTWAWSPDFSTKKKLLHKSEHSDLVLGPNGEDYYLSIDYQSNNGDVFFVNIDACPAVAASASDAPLCPRTALFQAYLNGASSAFHFSGKGFNKPGWAVVSTYAAKPSRDGSVPWYKNKVFAIELKANPRIYTLAYTRNAGGGYYAEPHASVSRDFTRIIFNSNWGVNGENIDAYIIHIPVTALPGGNTPPPAITGHFTGGNAPPRQATTNSATTARAASLTVTNAATGGSGDGAEGGEAGATTGRVSGTLSANRVRITPAGIQMLRRLVMVLDTGSANHRSDTAWAVNASPWATPLSLPALWVAHAGGFARLFLQQV